MKRQSAVDEEESSRTTMFVGITFNEQTGCQSGFVANGFGGWLSKWNRFSVPVGA